MSFKAFLSFKTIVPQIFHETVSVVVSLKYDLALEFYFRRPIFL